MDSGNPGSPNGADANAARLEAVKRHGADAVSFQALKAGATWWTDVPPPGGSGASLAYVPSGRSWIAIGTPLVEPGRRAEAVQRFCRLARAHHRRPVFFGVEEVTPFAGCRRLALGLQSILRASAWEATLRRWPKLREQLRRARAKGVTVRQVDPLELAPGMPLRAAVERLRAAWLGSRAMEPLHFLVAVEPFHAPSEHLYFVAERHGMAVQFLSAVPVYTRQGWLMEDMLRGHDAPNGTTELMIGALMQRLGGEPFWITPGLTPLAGPEPWWLRGTRIATVALYDFSGLMRFRARLHPAAWTPVWLVWDRGLAPLVMLDVLRAFAGGRIVRFASRSLLWHPSGPPWAVAVPLVAWTALLAGLAFTDHTDILGYSAATLRAWVLFDILLAAALFRVARKPRPRWLVAVAIVALFDAVVSIHHTAAVGFGVEALTALCRTVGAAGPIIGTTALFWAAWRAHRARVAPALHPEALAASREDAPTRGP
jgi:hypothetical protein